MEKSTITDIIVDYFNKEKCEKLTDTVAGWKLDYFVDNGEIFNDVLWAHKNTKYTLTVPVLTLQIEGFLRDSFNSIKKNDFNKYRKELKKRYEEHITEDNGFRRYIQLKNLDFLEKSFESLYDYFDPKNPDYSGELNRHGIFHGQIKNYNSNESSTKLFLLLDTLHHVVEDLNRQS